MRKRHSFFLALAAASLTASACNLIFSIDPGEPAAAGGRAPDAGSTGGGGSGGATTSSTGTTSSVTTSSSSMTGGTGGVAPCAPNTASCNGAVLHVCDANGSPMPAVTCDAIAACDPIARACIDHAMVPRLGVGVGRACAIEDNRTVRCWGVNNGNLVPGDAHVLLPTATPVPNVNGARMVSVGTGHACTLHDDGSVICWGSNDSGETGVAPGSGSAPAQVAMGSAAPALEISVAHRCSCARLADGTVRCWGQEDTGCFGNAAQAPTVTPTPTAVPGVGGAVQLRAGTYGTPTCVRRASGKVTCWGVNQTPKDIVGVDDATDITVARAMVLIRSASKGLVWAVPMGNGFSAASSYGVIGEIAAMTGGDAFCALKKDGGVGCAPIGNPPPPQPAPVPGLPAGTIVEIAAGYSLSYGEGLQCLRLAGSPIASRVHCWGDDLGGALGAGAPANFRTPQLVPAVTTAARVSASHTSTTVVLTSGAVVAWGQTSALPAAASASPHTVSILGTDNAIVHTHDVDRLAMVVKKTGALAIYDSGTATPGKRLLLAGVSDFVDVRTFGTYDLGLSSGGVLRVYGEDTHSNDSGIFGDGTNTATADAVATIPAITMGSAFAAHGNDYGVEPAHACAIAAGGSLFCWGNNYFGEVGSGAPSTTVSVPSTVTIPNDEPIVSVGVGEHFTCAASNAGAVYCWGDNRKGQLGQDAFTTELPTPTAVPGITNALGVTARESHACAWLADKTVVCWGANVDGQLGDGTFETRFAPVPVTGLTNVVEASAGPSHVCARHADGKISCWGSSYNGQVGTGVVGIFPAPRMVLGL